MKASLGFKRYIQERRQSPKPIRERKVKIGLITVYPVSQRIPLDKACGLTSIAAMITPDSGDPTPDISAPTDISPLGSPWPLHEQTASGDPRVADWPRIAHSPDFLALLRSKAAFILPATVFFLVYYFALPVLVGWFPELMKTSIGRVNLAYLFALSQFFMAWSVAGFYVVKAAGWDRAAGALLARFYSR